MLPFGHGISPFSEVWDACAACGKVGPVMGLRPLLHSDAKPRFAGLGRHRQPSRRAERHGYQSLTARQSRDLLLISGRVDCVNTPSPLASPPRSTPLGEVFNSCGVARARGSSCGSFLPSRARSGDLPPRRVNARVGLRSGWIPFQPKTAVELFHGKSALPMLRPLRVTFYEML